ncbi:MAG TPA: O-methyltransferase [Anaerolineales bacterium]|nr:O-methyltransferase [Anaerolineales bacterium]
MTHYNDRLADYVTRLFAPPDAALQRALTESPQRGLPAISIRPEEGKFLQFLVRACGAQKAVEIGTLGGYSGIWIARGLAPGGKLISLEKEPAHAAVAREHFDAAHLGDTVEIRIGDAHESLKRLGAEGPFDFVFIDAEKSGYLKYYDWAMNNVRVGGILAAHNAFRHGAVADPNDHDPDTETMRAFTGHAAADPRGLSTIYPAGDGMVVVVRVG